MHSFHTNDSLTDYKKAYPAKKAGISWRYSLSVCKKEVVLILQALPCALEVIK